MSKLPIQAKITISPVIGGFVVTYPKYMEGVEYPVEVTEVTTNVGKAMRVAKAAVTEFSLVAKSKDDEAGE